MRERLIELLKNAERKMTFEEMVDYLIDNGVAVLPRKVGDTIHFADEYSNEFAGKCIKNAHNFWTCSECGEWINPRNNYCPNCGARMDGDDV